MVLGKHQGFVIAKLRKNGSVCIPIVLGYKLTNDEHGKVLMPPIIRKWWDV